MIITAEKPPPCPNCDCPTLTIRERVVTLSSDRRIEEWSCDACGHGWKIWLGQAGDTKRNAITVFGGSPGSRS